MRNQTIFMDRCIRDHNPTRQVRWLSMMAALLMVLSITFTSSTTQKASAQSGNAPLAYAQVWGIKNGSYNAIWTYMTTPDPTAYNGYVLGGPNALTDLYYGNFVEGGPEKKCDPFCNLHPYGNWDNGTGVDHTFWDTSVNLCGGCTYAYKVVPFGTNQFQSQFCGSGCRGLVSTANMGTAKLPYVISGGESISTSMHFGSITTSTAQLSSNSPQGGGNWSFWCYTGTVNTVGGTAPLARAVTHLGLLITSLPAIKEASQ